MRIAIIGGGFSGVMVAVQLLRLACAPLSVCLIEPRPALGAGLAYGTDDPCHLLNVPAARMSAFPDDPAHFLRWLEGYGLDDAAGFVPRTLYGRYVRTVLEGAVARAPEARLEWFQAEAVAVDPAGDGAAIRLGDGQTVLADRVVLALGHFSPSDRVIADRSCHQARWYSGQPWTPDTLAHLAPTDSVLLVGSGLTMLDLVLTLHARAHEGRIHVLSRHGWLPKSHRGDVAAHPPLPVAATPPVTVARMLRGLRQAVAQAAVAGHDWQAVLDGLRSQTQTLWQALAPEEQRRFLRHLRPYWDAHRHRAPPEATVVLDRLARAGQLLVHAGRIHACRAQRVGVRVSYRPRRGKELVDLCISRVINCTGPETDYRALRQPLIAHLLKTGLIRPDPLYLGLDSDPGGRVLDARGQASGLLYTLGPPCKGVLWECTAVPEIREQAQALARVLLASSP